MTLIEIMVVLAIITAVVTLIIPRINNRNNQLKSAVREFIVLSRELHNRARLQGATYRLVIDMKDGPNSDTKHQYWVERSSQMVLARSSEDEEEEEDDDDEDGYKPSDGFEIDTQILKSQAKELPGDMIFESVEMASREEPLVSGRAYIHYLPQGLVEESAIHLKLGEEEDYNWTIAIHPLTGNALVVPKNISLKEIRDQ